MENKIECRLKEHGKPMTAVELIGAMSESAGEIGEALTRMTGDGRLVYTKKGKYALPDTVGLIPARAFVLRSGVPLAKPLDGDADMKISRRGELRAMHGDLIYVRREKQKRGVSDRCELVAVAERAHPTFTAVLQTAERKIEREPLLVGRGRRAKLRHREPEIVRVTSAEPFDMHIRCAIDVEGDLQGAQQGDAVVLRVIDWPRHKQPLHAEVQEVLGAGWDVRVQLRALIESHGLSEAFPDDALQEAAAFGEEPTEADMAGRFDARPVEAFTIDGADAKDFDDAVSLDRAEDGTWRLGVHIADVSHYVKENSAIDREALRRGVSVYLPGRTLPMLPEALCDQLCSLKPNVDRLAMSLFMTLRGGEVEEVRLERSVIRSRARMTYDEVNRLFDGQENAVPEALRGTLRDMLSLSRSLREKRHARGSVDFDLAEPQFTLDENGMPLDVCARMRGEAERLIEDFMLLANETVARMARERRLPCLYRIHEAPDPERVQALEMFLRNLNRPFRLGEAPQPVTVQRLLEETADTPEAEVIRRMTLRALKRARYDEQPEGHFGLAAQDYCHFTSPIRRYPDLVVHRQLARMLAGRVDEARAKQSAMPKLAVQCSRLEFEATSAERDADDLIRAHYMKKHVGEEFEGVVSGVTGWGFYVTLPNTVEGLVHVRTMDDYFELDEEKQMLRAEHSRRTIRLGDRARVRLAAVNETACEIDFEMLWPKEESRKRHAKGGEHSRKRAGKR